MSNTFWFAALAFTSMAWAPFCHTGKSVKRLTIGLILALVMGFLAIFLTNSEAIRFLAGVYLLMTSLFYLAVINIKKKGNLG